MPLFITEYPQFFTASIKGRYKLLQHDKYKDIIINNLLFLVEDKRIKLYAFVIMSDHIHLIWQMQPLIHPQHVQRDFFATVGVPKKSKTPLLSVVIWPCSHARHQQRVL